MKILLVEPGKQPRRMEIENTLPEMYRVLDCTTITAVYPWAEPVALVTDDEGLLRGKPLNRYLPELGQAIVGNFFLCGLGREDFADLPEALTMLLEQRFSFWENP